MNCHLLQNSFLCLATGHLPRRNRSHINREVVVHRKRRNRNAKKRDWNTKRRKQLRHDICEKEILKHLTETLNEEKAKQKWQTETRQTQKDQSRQNIPLDTRIRFAPLQNICGEVLDKEAKNYKEKEILLRRHQTPVYRKQNHRPNPVIKHFPENDNPLWQQRTVPGNSKYSDTVRNGKKTFIVGTSMVKASGWNM